MDYPKLISVYATDSHELVLGYDSGEIRVLDMRPYLNKGSYSRLLDLELFKSAEIVYGAVTWGEKLDIDPEFVFDYSKPVKVERAAT